MSVMKKILEMLKKPKKKDSTECASDQLCKDAVSDPPRYLKSDVPSRKDMYKNFRIDNSCKSTVQSEQNFITSNSDVTSSLQENSLNFFQPSSLNSDAMPIIDNSSRLRSVSAPQEPTQNVAAESHLTTNGQDMNGLRSSFRNVHEHGSGFGFRSESSTGTENNAPVRSESSFWSVRNGSENSVPQTKPKQEKNNTYVINISHSQHFQIGSQKNVFVNGSENGSMKIKNLKRIQKQQENLHPQNDLLNVTRQITPQELTKIASHVNDNWEEIGRLLGIPQSEMDDIVMVNDNNSNVIVFDMFNRFLKNNPETSVGFVANILLQSNQYRAIQQLAP